VVAVMSSFGDGQKLHNNLELNIWELDSGISVESEITTVAHRLHRLLDADVEALLPDSVDNAKVMAYWNPFSSL
jgi:hypothetical protein